MRIVLDLQGAQSESRYRGIGRYTLSLAQAMIRNANGHEIFILLNGLLPNAIEYIRESFYGLLAQENILIWHAPGHVCEWDHVNADRRKMAEAFRRAFIAKLRPDVVHVSSLFEGFVDDAVTGSEPQTDYKEFVTLYDLIPFLNPDEYLKPNPDYQRFYMSKIEQLKHMDGWLGISESSCREGIQHLGLLASQTFNISAAVDDKFKRLRISSTEEKAFRSRLGLKKDYVLYAGGADNRKNLDGLFKAYAALNPDLRASHQLVIAGKLAASSIEALKKIALRDGLASDDLLFTDYVTDEDLVVLYNLCKLFVFPSWHEGFGLPVLEAMSCGAPVIAANCTSLPEVVGRQDALFDIDDEKSFAQKLFQVLDDKNFREELARHGIERAKTFTWDNSAKLAIQAFEKSHSLTIQKTKSAQSQMKKRLAYISPLPPERSGIADYSAELLPELARYYEIDVINPQETISDEWVATHCQLRGIDWFLKNSSEYDRVLYHFGNSPFHQHMFECLDRVPGVVVLHDFFMSGVVAHMDHGPNPGMWARELLYSHGYHAVAERFHTQNIADVIYKYPCNLRLMPEVMGQNTIGMVVHSNYSKELASRWYSPDMAERWVTVPLLRIPAKEQNKKLARESVKLPADAFVVCSFGILDPSKQNQRLLDAWLASDMAQNPKCYLIFVGENHGGDYGKKLSQTIESSTAKNRVRITGWTETSEFRSYLAAADVGVQLRTLSRGETSATVLDCMNYGLATIANANGSMADLPATAVWMLADEYKDQELVAALNGLLSDPKKREELAKNATRHIRTHHSPSSCAQQYVDAIEKFYSKMEGHPRPLIKKTSQIALTSKGKYLSKEIHLREIAHSMSRNFNERPWRELLVDVSAISRNDLKTGIERVVRALTLEWIENTNDKLRVMPVYLSDLGGQWHYRYASKYTLKLLGCPNDWLADEPVEPQPGDQFVGVDHIGGLVTRAEGAGVYRKLKESGVSIHFVVYDLLSVNHPEFFPPGAKEGFEEWLRVIARVSDGLYCISRAVADDLQNWLKANSEPRQRSVRVGHFHLGADVASSVPSKGLTEEDKRVLTHLEAHESFLMVGTIEPRKGHLQTLGAFELLWKQGMNVNLVIVGNEGWKGLPADMRRTIPTIVERLANHPELGRRLFWLQGISDEFLEKVYAASVCLMATSDGEGFGLPLIEAAHHKLAIIGRDLPVFREVAGPHAYYFKGDAPESIATTVEIWLEKFKRGGHPKSIGMPFLTWRQSAADLLKTMNS